MCLRKNSFFLFDLFFNFFIDLINSFDKAYLYQIRKSEMKNYISLLPLE